MGHLLFIILSISAYSAEPKISPTTIKIIYEAARKNKIDAQLLIRIAYTESRFKESAIRVNKNGTIDYGMFQINSVHWSTMCKELDITTLKGNTACAAKLISLIKSKHGNDPHWIGRYHSKTPSKKLKYFKLLKDTPFIALAKK